VVEIRLTVAQDLQAARRIVDDAYTEFDLADAGKLQTDAGKRDGRSSHAD